MLNLDMLDDSTKERILSIWKTMNDEDRNHFIDQIALAMSIWGSDEIGRVLVLEVLRLLIVNGSLSLSDFGLYLDQLDLSDFDSSLKDKVERTSMVLEGYRIKHALPSEPHRDIGL